MASIPTWIRLDENQTLTELIRLLDRRLKELYQQLTQIAGTIPAAQGPGIAVHGSALLTPSTDYFPDATSIRTLKATFDATVFSNFPVSAPANLPDGQWYNLYFHNDTGATQRVTLFGTSSGGALDFRSETGAATTQDLTDGQRMSVRGYRSGTEFIVQIHRW